MKWSWPSPRRPRTPTDDAARRLAEERARMYEALAGLSRLRAQIESLCLVIQDAGPISRPSPSADPPAPPDEPAAPAFTRAESERPSWLTTIRTGRGFPVPPHLLELARKP